MNRKMKISIGCILPVVLFSLVSCATTPKADPPPNDDFKADLGTIGLVAARFQPEIGMQKPMAKGTAAFHGAGVGAMSVARAGAGCTGVGCAGILALIPVGAVIGGIVGGVQGVSKKSIQETEQVLKSYLTTLHFQEIMRDRFLSIARDQTRNPIVLLEVEAPDALDQEISYDSLKGQDIQTVLELSVRKCSLRAAKSLRGSGAEKQINPYFRLLLAVGVRLIRVTDGHLLWSHVFIYEYESPLHRFYDWGTNHGQPFVEELDQAFKSLSLEIAGRLSNIQKPLIPSSSNNDE